MRHTQEQLAAVLNRQRRRGIEDAKLARSFGHNNEALAYPNVAYPDITKQAVDDAYRHGWAMQRRQMNKPDAICAEVFGKGVRHSIN